MKMSLLLTCLFVSSTALSHVVSSDPRSITAVYADLALLRSAGIPVLFADEGTSVGYAAITGDMQNRLSDLSHKNGRCGNFEALPEIPRDLSVVKNNFSSMNRQLAKDQEYLNVVRNIDLGPHQVIVDALQELKSDNIKETVTWLSSYPSRYNRAASPNTHVDAMFAKLKAMTADLPYATVEMIAHKNTPQKSIRVSLKGSQRPEQYVILGGHLDSINGWGGSGPAPGADDNASGSASILEAMRVFITKGQPQRTVEFMWYAGEESGLLGSAEIAESYKLAKRNVIGVLQLDMTMFPGDGEGKIASINDFTSPWLRDYLRTINTAYIGVEIFDDKCGYGCSDHASWNRRGYPALMPAEAKFNTMFQDLHTPRDVISPVMSFTHSLVFSKIALVMALDLGNSNASESAP